MSRHREKTPTHIFATFTQLEIFIKIYRTGKGIRSFFLHHEIQRHLLIAIIYTVCNEYEKYSQEKFSFSEFSLFMCFGHPAEYASTFVREC